MAGESVTFKDSALQLESLVLTVGDKTFDVSDFTLDAAVGVFPSCIATIVQGLPVGENADSSVTTVIEESDSFLGVDAQVTLTYTTYGESIGEGSTTRTLMAGKVSAVTRNIATYPAGIQVRYRFMIQTAAAFLDGFPLGDMYFIAGESGNYMTLKKSAFNMSNGTLVDALQGTQPEVNLADAVAKMMDAIGTDGKSAAPAMKIEDAIDTSTCPEMTLSFTSVHPLAQELERQILDIVGQYPLYEAYHALIRSFFLELIPNFFDEMAESYDYKPGEKMIVLPKIAWWKNPSGDPIDQSVIISTSHGAQGKGRNEIDGVAVKYTLNAVEINNKESEDLGAMAVFAEGTDTNGQPKLIRDPQELRENGTKLASRIITVPLPKYLSFGMRNALKNVKNQRNQQGDADPNKPNTSTTTDDVQVEEDWAKKWAEIIAQMTFAEVNRSNQKLTLEVGFLNYITIRSELGRVVEVQVPKMSSSSAQVDSGEYDTMYGYLEATRLQIQLGWDKVRVSALLILSHVRTEAENNILGIDESLLYGGQKQ